MRIIGGEWGGRKLFAPEGMDTRPTADRVREALFNILRDRVKGARVWDMYAGSGALALEALSRGAAQAVLTEPSRKAADVIRRNINHCGAEAQARLLATSWEAAIPTLRGDARFSLIFLDPPYRMVEAYAQAARRLIEADLLSEDALLVMEHRRGTAIEGLTPDFEVCDSRRYGEVCLELVQMRRCGE